MYPGERRGRAAEFKVKQLIEVAEWPHGDVVHTGDNGGPDLRVDGWCEVEVKTSGEVHYNKGKKSGSFRFNLQDLRRGHPLTEDVLVVRCELANEPDVWFVIPGEVCWGHKWLRIPLSAVEMTTRRSKYAPFREAWGVLGEILQRGRPLPSKPVIDRNQTYMKDGDDVPF